MTSLMHLILNGKIYTNRYVRDGATARRSFAQKDALWMTMLGSYVHSMYIEAARRETRFKDFNPTWRDLYEDICY